MVRRKRNVRTFWTVIHRWAGLVMAGFLVIAGLTGALLAWNNELDAAFNPELFEAPPPSPEAEMLDPLVLRAQVQAAYPQAYAAMAMLDTKPGHALVVRLFGLPDPVTGTLKVPAADQVFVDPYTGRILGERKWGDITQGKKNLMPFIYRLHYSLALDEWGGYALGIVALLWTLDCFVGAYLTFPAPQRKAPRPWLVRWRPSWQIRWKGGAYKVNFDLHRAGGLWVWAMLFVLAWSSVAFNLHEVYEPVMRAAFSRQPDTESLPAPQRLDLAPEIGWQAARDTGRRLMAEQARAHDFAVLRETLLVHDPRYGTHGIYRYQVKSSRDIRDEWGSTQVIFDADTGELLRLWMPTGAAGGDTIRTWITSLHMAALWGLPMKLFVCTMGLMVAMLSVTGVVIWTRKRRARGQVRKPSENPQVDRSVRVLIE